VTGSDWDRASEAVDARRAPTLDALSSCCIPATGGCPWETPDGLFARGLPARVSELTPSEVPGLEP
jgi:hypothetical protein